MSGRLALVELVADGSGVGVGGTFEAQSGVVAQCDTHVGASVELFDNAYLRFGALKGVSGERERLRSTLPANELGDKSRPHLWIGLPTGVEKKLLHCELTSDAPIEQTDPD
jgi:hypothetical protein